MRLQVPRNLWKRIMLPSGDFPLDWELFAHHFATLRVDPSRPHFPEKWQFVLVWAYHRRCLDAAHKWGVEDATLKEVCWMGNGKLPW